MTISKDIQDTVNELGPPTPESKVHTIRCSHATAHAIKKVSGPMKNPIILGLRVESTNQLPNEVSLLLDKEGTPIGYLDSTGVHWIEELLKECNENLSG